jgi:hypothetical protein
VLVLVVLMASPAAAAAPAATECVGWIETLESWWAGLAQLFTGAGTTADGPTIDPGGASASGEQETDGGPGIDPGG